MPTTKEKFAQSYHWDMRAQRVKEKAYLRAEQIREGEHYVEKMRRRDEGAARGSVGLSVRGRVFFLRGIDGCTYDCTNNGNMGTHGYPLGTAVYERIGDALMLANPVASANSAGR